MNSVILQTAVRTTTPLLTVLSVFLLLRGHDEPGGGFIAGLLFVSAVALHILAFGVVESRRMLRIDPRTLMGVGVGFVATSGILGLIVGRPFLAGLWGVAVPGIGKLSSILLFDVGVFLVVVGTAVLALFTLEEEEG
jgi:multicomponent Na+:H+ antiporter subunit B